MSPERVAVFIDGSNFYHALKECSGSHRIDFAHLAAQLVGPHRLLVRVYYYNAPVSQREVPDQYKAQQVFFEYIKSLDYFELKLGRLVRRPDTGKLMEKGVDVQLAVDMVGFASKNLYDTAVLISGDGDFSDAVQYVKDMGKHVEVSYPVGGKLHQLKSVCDKYVPLDATHLRKAPWA